MAISLVTWEGSTTSSRPASTSERMRKLGRQASPNPATAASSRALALSKSKAGRIGNNQAYRPPQTPICEFLADCLIRVACAAGDHPDPRAFQIHRGRREKQQAGPLGLLGAGVRAGVTGEKKPPTVAVQITARGLRLSTTRFRLSLKRSFPQRGFVAGHLGCESQPIRQRCGDY